MHHDDVKSSRGRTSENSYHRSGNLHDIDEDEDHGNSNRSTHGGRRGGPPSSDTSSHLDASTRGVLRREEKLRQATEKALEFKRQIEEQGRKDQEAFERAQAEIGEKLKAWAEDNGKKRNIRTLLSTMHTVLWPSARWKPCSLGDLLTPAQVKIKYHRAMLIVHPDRNVKLCGTEKFVAKRVFEAVNEAYAAFQAQELA